jgi:hypothetical protein
MHRERGVRESNQHNHEQDEKLSARCPAPAARPISDFVVESVGDSLVIFDAASLHYHTLNSTARQIWSKCDGAGSPDSIARDLAIPRELVELTVAELGESGLLVETEGHWDATVTRRRAAKLIAAGLAGAVGFPIVTSITVPDSASAETQNECVVAGALYGPCDPTTQDGQVGCLFSCVKAGHCTSHCKSISGSASDGCCFCYEDVPCPRR